MRRSSDIVRSTLALDQVKQLIDTAAKKGVQALSLTGGEPLIHLDDIVTLVQHARSAGIPHVRTGTNGYIFASPESPHFTKRVTSIAEKLSLSGLHSFWISMDSANPADHESMRGLKGIVKGIEQGLSIFHAHGIYPSANLGINRNTGGKNPMLYRHDQDPLIFSHLFKESFEKFYGFILNLGFTTASVCYPMSHSPENPETEESDNSVYGATSSDRVIHFTPEEKGLIFQALYETIPKFRHKLRIFTPLCSLYSLIEEFQQNRKPLYGCRGGTDFFFIDCLKGQIHPCGYLNNTFSEIPDLNKRLSEKATCNRCQWECFKDPSELMGPFAELFSTPLTLAQKIRNNPVFFQLLWNDLKYFRACNYFDGKIPPNYQALRAFTDSRFNRNNHVPSLATSS